MKRLVLIGAAALYVAAALGLSGCWWGGGGGRGDEGRRGGEEGHHDR